MTDAQWTNLLRILEGEILDPLPAGFLVDGPWVSASAGATLMDYFCSDDVWLRANLDAHRRWPGVLWLPGLWAEYGMISNPPSFGAKCVWPQDGFPTCEPVLRGCDDIALLKQPDVRTDGLLPLVIHRLERNRAAIERAGHRIRFATAHGPLTIAGYLLGHTELFLAMKEEPDAIHRLLRIVTRFVSDWLLFQKERFATIDGILVMEDFMGFIGEEDCREFAVPYIAEILGSFDASVRFLHNDAAGLITARHLAAMNVNLFNFSFEHDFNEVRRLAGDGVTLLGNIPPRDVLAAGTPEDVSQSVRALVDSIADKRRVIVSAGGFAPGAFDGRKIDAFCAAVAGA